MAQLYKPTELPRSEPSATDAMEHALILLVDVLSRKGVLKLEDYDEGLREMLGQVKEVDTQAAATFKRLIGLLAQTIAERDRRAAKKV